MQENVYAYKTPLWRRIMTIVLLPTITFLWIIGTILTQIGSQMEQVETRQKIKSHNIKIEECGEESKTPDEYSKVVYEQEIIA